MPPSRARQSISVSRQGAVIQQQRQCAHRQPRIGRHIVARVAATARAKSYGARASYRESALVWLL
jgi:hypothetical protein